MSKLGILPLFGVLGYWYLVYLAYVGLVHSTELFAGLGNLVVLVVLILVGVPISAILAMISFAIFDN